MEFRSNETQRLRETLLTSGLATLNPPYDYPSHHVGYRLSSDYQDQTWEDSQFKEQLSRLSAGNWPSRSVLGGSESSVSEPAAPLTTPFSTQSSPILPS